MHSTIGRHAARAVSCAVQVDELAKQWDLLLANMAKGDLDTFNAPSFPRGEQRGMGFHEAPRGILSHWVVIEDGKNRNYTRVVPTTSNAASTPPVSARTASTTSPSVPATTSVAPNA